MRARWPLRSMAGTLRRLSKFSHGSGDVGQAEATAAPQPRLGRMASFAENVYTDQKERVSAKGRRFTKVLHRGGVKPVHDSCRVAFHVKLDSLSPARVEHAFSSQHEFHWDAVQSVIDGVSVSIPAGSFNMQGSAIPFSDSENMLQLELFQQLLAATLTAGEHDMWVEADHFGSMPIHALTLSNRDLSIAFVIRAARSRPELLCQQHLPPIFTGETCLHILAVNCREDELCDLLDVAHGGLSEGDVDAMYSAAATGIFFQKEPQIYSGSTAIAYAACFGMKRVVQKMLVRRPTAHLLNVGCCPHTGFSPLHAVIAIGVDFMIDYLLDLPSLSELDPWPAGYQQQQCSELYKPTELQHDVEERGSDHGRLTAIANKLHTLRTAGLVPRGLTPLQLAVFFGEALGANGRHIVEHHREL